MTLEGQGEVGTLHKNSQSGLCNLYSKQFTVKMHKKLHIFLCKT